MFRLRDVSAALAKLAFLDARSHQPVRRWDEGVQRALLVGCCLPYNSHAVLSFSWHERLLVWAAVMINNTRLSYIHSLHPHSTHLDVLGTRHVISFDTGQRLVRSGTRLSSPGLSHALHPYFSTV